MKKSLPPKGAKTDCLQKEQLPLWFRAVGSIPNYTIRAYLQVLLLTGARRNELLLLRWQDVDLNWNTLTLKDKVKQRREIPLTPYVKSLITALPKESDYVFASHSSSSGHLEDPTKAYQKALASTEAFRSLPYVSLHGLRRSFGTLAGWVECPVGIAAQIMGHQPSAIAEKHYRQRPIDLLRQWHSRLRALFWQMLG